jgi:hypothetical protein
MQMKRGKTKGAGRFVVVGPNRPCADYLKAPNVHDAMVSQFSTNVKFFSGKEL